MESAGKEDGEQEGTVAGKNGKGNGTGALMEKKPQKRGEPPDKSISPNDTKNALSGLSGIKTSRISRLADLEAKHKTYQESVQHLVSRRS